MGYYITDKETLVEELRSRIRDKSELAAAVNAFAEKEYGIRNYIEVTQQNLCLSPVRFYGALCRQVATARIEEICYSIACQYLGLSPVNLTFGIDTFSTRNTDKVNLVKNRLVVGHSKNGQPIIRVSKIANPQSLEGMILQEIVIDSGQRLLEYHQGLRIDAFGNRCPSIRDVGSIFSLYLRMAKKRPLWVFEIKGRWTEKKPTENANLFASRPPASWYYPLYLANFALGNLVLFETYENKKGDVPKIKEEFEAAMDLIKDAIGVYPMVIQTPPLNPDMMLINTALLRSDWRGKIAIPENFCGDTLSLFSLIAHQAISVKHSDS